MPHWQAEQERKYFREYYARNETRYHGYYLQRKAAGALSKRTPEANSKSCKKYRRSHSDECYKSVMRWKREHRDRINEQARKHYHETKVLKGRGLGLTPEQMRLRKSEQRKARREKINAYEKNRAKVDIEFALRRRLRSRIRDALNSRHLKKLGSTSELVGCTFGYLRLHIESQFKPGMSWKCRSEWHLDHIKPLALFMLRDLEQQKAAFHYTNLQPLWAKDNQMKSDKWIAPHLATRILERNRL